MEDIQPLPSFREGQDYLLAELVIGIRPHPAIAEKQAEVVPPVVLARIESIFGALSKLAQKYAYCL